MNKAKINYIIDFILLLFFVGTAITGLIIFFFMPSGVRRGGSQNFIGIVKGTWTDVHNWLGIVMIVIAVIHIVLHWKWIVCLTKNVFKIEINKNDKCDK